MTIKEIINDHNNYIMPTYAPGDVCFEKGEGCYLFDENNKKYLDFISGIAVNCLGYNHPALNETIQKQAAKIIHISNLFANKQQIELGKKLNSKFGGGKTFFCNSGAEAIEGAIKLARKYSRKFIDENKYEFITMKKSFHGRTLTAITATGQEKYQTHLDPLPEGFSYAQFGDIESIKELISYRTCAIIIEPIQGEGGINQADKSFWKELSELCKKKSILLIFDEIQTGVGRTGKFFAYEHYGIKPDIITLAKGLGGGMPIGAIIARDEVANSFCPGDHASTFGGNYLACAAANTVIETIEKENILDHVQKMEKVVHKLASDLKKEFSFIDDIRGKGLMWGIDINSDKVDTAKIVKEGLKHGIILNCIGGHILRIAPPLIISEKELAEGFKLIKEILKKTKAST